MNTKMNTKINLLDILEKKIDATITYSYKNKELGVIHSINNKVDDKINLMSTCFFIKYTTEVQTTKNATIYEVGLREKQIFYLEKIFNNKHYKNQYLRIYTDSYSLKNIYDTQLIDLLTNLNEHIQIFIVDFSMGNCGFSVIDEEDNRKQITHKGVVQMVFRILPIFDHENNNNNIDYVFSIDLDDVDIL